MKVTVSFDGTKVVVPCDSGEITVTEMGRRASARYNKAMGTSNSFHVSVSSIKLDSTGALLDPDDNICDVCNDEESLTAAFDTEMIADHGDGGSNRDETSFISHKRSEEGSCISSSIHSINHTSTTYSFKGDVTDLLKTEGQTDTSEVQVCLNRCGYC